MVGRTPASNSVAHHFYVIARPDVAPYGLAAIMAKRFVGGVATVWRLCFILHWHGCKFLWLFASVLFGRVTAFSRPFFYGAFQRTRPGPPVARVFSGRASWAYFLFRCCRFTRRALRWAFRFFFRAWWVVGGFFCLYDFGMLNSPAYPLSAMAAAAATVATTGPARRMYPQRFSYPSGAMSAGGGLSGCMGHRYGFGFFQGHKTVFASRVAALHVP